MLCFRHASCRRLKTRAALVIYSYSNFTVKTKVVQVSQESLRISTTPSKRSSLSLTLLHETVSRNRLKTQKAWKHSRTWSSAGSSTRKTHPAAVRTVKDRWVMKTTLTKKSLNRATVKIAMTSSVNFRVLNPSNSSHRIMNRFLTVTWTVPALKALATSR